MFCSGLWAGFAGVISFLCHAAFSVRSRSALTCCAMRRGQSLSNLDLQRSQLAGKFLDRFTLSREILFHRG